MFTVGDRMGDSGPKELLVETGADATIAMLKNCLTIYSSDEKIFL